MYKLTFTLFSIFTASVGYADNLSVTLVFNTLPATYESGSYGSAGATYNGYVPGTVDGIMAAVMCDDSAHTTYVPSGNMIYNYSTLTGPTPLVDGSATVRFTGSTALNLDETEEYEAAAVLLSELGAVSNPSGNTITDYQYAIWNMFTPTDMSVNATQLNLQESAAALVKAGADSTVADYSHLVVYTPTEAFSSSQEFIGLDTPTVPEPASWTLMALLLGLLLCIPRVRSRLYAVLSRS